GRELRTVGTSFHVISTRRSRRARRSGRRNHDDGRPAGAGRPSYGAPRRSVAEALTALGVEQVSVLRGGPEVHRLPLARRTTRIDTGDERLVRLVGTGATAVDEGVRAELLDQVDLDGQALVVGGDLQVLGAHAHGHRGLVGLREGG